MKIVAQSIPYKYYTECPIIIYPPPPHNIRLLHFTTSALTSLLIV